MKKFAFIFAFTVLFGSLFAQETIEISGKIKGFGNGYLLMSYRFDGNRFRDTIVVKNDVVSFKKDIKLPELVWADLLCLSDELEDSDILGTGFFIKNGAPIVLEGDVRNIYFLKAHGSPLFDEVSSLRERTKANIGYIIALNKVIMSEHKDLFGEDIIKKLEAKRDSIGRSNEIEENFMNTNKNSVYAAYLYSTNLLGKSAAEVESHYNSLTDEVKNSPFGKQIFAYMETAKKVAPGAVAPAFTQKDINGKTVTLKQFKGKYVLLCFWGSWCGPCRRSHAHLMEMINKYQGKNFQAVGFASDRNKDKWKEAIEVDKLNFIHCNLFDKYKGEDVAKLYNIKAFPTKILIDPQGKIVGTVIGGDPKELDDLLENALGK